MTKRYAYYCKENDVLVYADNVREARDYAEYRLSPAYGFAPDRAATLKLARVSASRADALDGYAITWEAR